MPKGFNENSRFVSPLLQQRLAKKWKVRLAKPIVGSNIVSAVSSNKDAGLSLFHNSTWLQPCSVKQTRINIFLKRAKPNNSCQHIAHFDSLNSNVDWPSNHYIGLVAIHFVPFKPEAPETRSESKHNVPIRATHTST